MEKACIRWPLTWMELWPGPPGEAMPGRVPG